MNNTTVEMLQELKADLQTLAQKPHTGKVFVGFDGFVDNIKKAIKQRQGSMALYYDSIRSFGERISDAKGKSGQIEMDTVRTKIGGNGPILSDTLGKLGVDSVCIGSLGFPEIHPVFSILNSRCHVISVLDPGVSDAIEFEDGKLIFSDLKVFDQYNWSFIKNRIGIDRIRESILESSLLALVDWVNLPHASDIWKGLLQDVIKPSGRKDFLFLFDLCDPSKKTPQQIDEVLDLIGFFSAYGKVTLGLNENETQKIWASIKGIGSDNLKSSKGPSLAEMGDALYKAMNIDFLLVHPIDRTVVFHQRDVVELQGRLVTKPKVLTGGGDNLNAGYCLGLLYGFLIEKCMLLGMAASGAYIENGTSPDIQSLIKYIDVWIAEVLEESTEFGKKHIIHT